MYTVSPKYSQMGKMLYFMLDYSKNIDLFLCLEQMMADGQFIGKRKQLIYKTKSVLITQYDSEVFSPINTRTHIEFMELVYTCLNPN
jgi:hypothetical protein